MRGKLKPTGLDLAGIDGSEKEIYSSTLSKTVIFKHLFLFFELLVLIFFFVGCTNIDERRTIWKSKRVLASQKKDISELNEVRSKLKKVIQRKVQAVELLESTNRLLARKYMDIGGYNLALEALNEAEFLKPNNAFIKKDLGECYYFLAISSIEREEKEKYFSIARRFYEAFLNLDPDLTEARYGLGLLLFFGFDDVLRAIEEMKKILVSEPDNVEAHFALGRFYYEINEMGKSLGEYITLTRLLPRGSQKLKRAEENIIKINRELEISGR